MTIFDYIAEYERDREAELPTDGRAATVVSMLEELKKAATGGKRPKSEQEWYINERYLDGDHYLKFDRKAGTVTFPKNKTRVQRSYNIAKAQLRANKNFILSQNFTWQVAPRPNLDPEGRDEQAAAEEADRDNKILSAYIYDITDVPYKLRRVLDYGLTKRFGCWEVVWDGDIDNVQLNPLDPFDVYPDPNVSDPRDGLFLIKTAKVSVARIKANEAYNNNKNAIKADKREASSDFKDSLEKGRSADNPADLDETGTAIVSEYFLKRFTPGTAQPEVWLLTVAGGKLIRDPQNLGISRFPILFYFPERFDQQLYGPTWFKDVRTVNRMYENVLSIIEDYILKIKPKLARPKGSSIKNVTDQTGEILEYSGAIADQLKEISPQGLPATHFRALDIAQALIEDIGGIHAPSRGKVPAGVKSGRGIEALQSADENNIGDPKTELEKFLEETAETILDFVSRNQVTQRTLEHYDGKTTFGATVMGKAGVLEGSEVPENTVVITPRRVRVSIVPAMGYTEEGKRQTALDLYEAKLIDAETTLETFRFSNIGAIIEKVMRERAQEVALKQAGQQPVPPEVPPQAPPPMPA